MQFRRARRVHRGFFLSAFRLHRRGRLAVACARAGRHGAPLDKQFIVSEIVAALTRELEGSLRSAKAAHAEATDEQSKAENKYDTRGLEASYLARGQSRQAAEVMQAIQLYETLPLRDLEPGEPIGLGSLVELKQSRERSFYFIGPRAGGTEVECEGKLVLVLTPNSPFGQQLVGRQVGDRVQMAVGRGVETYEVISAR
jgi:transcription elongation GreA/GreB family factor